MSNKEMKEGVVSLQERYHLTDFEALQIVLKKEELRLFAKAHVLIKGEEGELVPSALESIAICLGTSTNFTGSTVKDLLSNIDDSLARKNDTA